MADTFNLAARVPPSLAPAAPRIDGTATWRNGRPRTGRGDRVLPGEGGGEAAALAGALDAAGWDGTLDVEIFSTPDAFWGARRRGGRATCTRGRHGAPRCLD